MSCGIKWRYRWCDTHLIEQKRNWLVWGAANWRDYESQRRKKKDSFLLLCKFDVSTQNLTYLLFNITPTSHLRNIPLRVQISFNIIHFGILNIEYIKESVERNTILVNKRQRRRLTSLWNMIARCRERANL